MKKFNKTYKEYLSLTEEEKDEYSFYIKFGDYERKDFLSETPLEERSFITVKTLMNDLIEGNVEDLTKDLQEIEEYSEKVIMKKNAFHVLASFEYIINHIVSLIKMEGEMLTSNVPGTDYSNYIQQVDFSMFPNYYSQLRTLAGGDLTKFEEIKNMKYSDCFVELLYIQKEEDLNKLISQRKK